MGLSRVILAFALMVPLSACAVADLVAHGVKEFDKSQNPNVQPASAPAHKAESQPAVVRDEEPPAPMYSGPAAAPSRGSVTVEELK